MSVYPNTYGVVMSFGGELPKRREYMWDKKNPTYKELVDMVWSMTEKDQEELSKLLENNKNGRQSSERREGRVPRTRYA